MSGDEWRREAACIGQGRIMFNPRTTELAKQFCSECPVLVECRSDALRSEPGADERWHAGVRAGMTPAEFVNYRRRWRRRQRKETA